MQNPERLKELAEQVRQGTASEHTYQEIINLVNADESGEVVERLNALHSEKLLSEQGIPDFRSDLWQNGTKEVLAAAKLPANTGTPAMAPVRGIPFLKTGWFRYAAILLLMAGTAGYLFYKTPQKPAGIAKQQTDIHNITPGKDGAILTLADGTEMVLDSLGNGIVTTQAGTRIVYSNGQLQYQAEGMANKTLAYNTIRTPKGRQFKLILSDGTAVWLNSGSQITYPTVFETKNRSVSIEGEVYFEVTENPGMPFLVNVRDGLHVEVLGTHFNINAYEKEQVIKTTLLEGSVKVSTLSEEGKTAKSVLLKPGQQARLSTAGDSVKASGIQIAEADVQKVIAWKNGLFNFEDASLQEVMNQLERWYDIDVVYEKGIPDMYFMGKMSREMQLPNLLKALEQSGVHFRLEEGRKLVVIP